MKKKLQINPSAGSFPVAAATGVHLDIADPKSSSLPAIKFYQLYLIQQKASRTVSGTQSWKGPLGIKCWRHLLQWAIELDLCVQFS